MHQTLSQGECSKGVEESRRLHLVKMPLDKHIKPYQSPTLDNKVGMLPLRTHFKSSQCPIVDKSMNDLGKSPGQIGVDDGGRKMERQGCLKACKAVVTSHLMCVRRGESHCSLLLLSLQ